MVKTIHLYEYLFKKKKQKKIVFKLMNNSNANENIRNHRDIKLVTKEKKRLKLVSEPNYHTTKHFEKNICWQ